MKLLEGNKYWRRFEYAGLLAASLVIALLASWTSMGMQIDHDAYDWLFRIHRPADWPAQSVILAIDEPTLQAMADMTGGEYYRAENAAELLQVFLDLPAQITLQKQNLEISALFSALGAITIGVAIALSLLWNRFP